VISVPPLDALALTLHHAPGVEALLVGSGLSRSAGIPTGWDITLDLIRRLAALQGITDEPDWAAWYLSNYKKEPSYSEILDALAITQAERRSILQQYIEGPNGELRDPTPAHAAIASLVAIGSVKVIVTTNFDRLLETALRAAGVEPTVISTADAVSGATPLMHAKCTVIKVHGDYMDTRIKNTDAELTSYPIEINGLLDQIFDQFGVVVIGWSGDWDTALRDAIMRSGSRRYPFFWATRGEPSPLAKDIIAQRDGRVVPISDADAFFTELAQKVQALKVADRPHPTSREMVLALGKKYCRDDKYAMEWSDLLACEVAKIRAFVTGADWPTGHPNVELINDLVTKIVGRTEAIRRLCLIGARWGTENAQESIQRAIAGITFFSTAQGGFTWWISLREMAASLCFYWAAAGAIYNRDYRQLAKLFNMPIRSTSSDKLGIQLLPLSALDSVDWKVLTGFERNNTPGSDFMLELFQTEALDIVVSSEELEPLWNETEFLIALEFTHHRLARMAGGTAGWFWAPPGRFIWSRLEPLPEDRLTKIQNLDERSPLLAAGLLGGRAESAVEAANALKEFVAKNFSSWRW
jgi:hypothetical protein